jgi:hypothetical protein
MVLPSQEFNGGNALAGSLAEPISEVFLDG